MNRPAPCADGPGDPDGLDQLAARLSGKRRTWILTGAGISVASGIPAYRDALGAWRHDEPMQHQEFMQQAAARRRYWRRGMSGWPVIANAQPNATHLAVAELQRLGRVRLVVTQNVDGLHAAAGATDVVDLHGRLDRVVCTHCDAVLARADYQDMLQRHNPQVEAAGVIRPDGDVELEATDLDAFQVPPCPQCGGVMKPDVVFYGGSVPRRRVERAMTALEESDAVLVLGSSLSVFSALRFIRRAQSMGLPLLAVNPGMMREQHLFEQVLAANCETVLPRLAARLT